jgi:hypothetical protein
MRTALAAALEAWKTFGFVNMWLADSIIETSGLR